jgi:drug/metabolite transporter (DMT)-like permease
MIAMSAPRHSTHISGPGPTALPVSPAPERDNMRGLAWIAVSVVASSAMAIAVRGASQELDSPMVVMLRAGLTSLLLLAVILPVTPLRRQLRCSRPWLHVLRGTLIAVSTNLGFYTLANIPLATAAVLFFTAPIFATILGALLHAEPVGPRRMAAIAAGFAGALVILRPGYEAFHPAMLTALGSSLFFAFALSLSRNLAEADGPLSTFFSSVLITSLLTLPLAAPVFALPELNITWIAIVVLILTGVIRGVADIQAYRHAEASILAPVTYLRLVFIGIASYLIFGETIDGPTLAGASIIVASTLYIAQREAVLRRRASRKSKQTAAGLKQN